MNERQLRAYKLALETGTLVQAARMMNVSAPAVSQMLTALEEELGFALFNRRQGQVSPTPHGRFFLQAAERAISSFDAAREVGQMLRRNPLGQIRVSVSPGTTLQTVPRVVAKFRKEFPDCQVSVQARTSPHTVELISHQVVDFGVVDAPFHEGKGDGVTFRSPLHCVFRAGHPLASRKTVTPVDLQNFQLVTLSEDLHSTQKLLEAFRAAGTDPKRVAECNLFASVIATALYSDLVGFAPGNKTAHAKDLAEMDKRPFEPSVFYECSVLQSEGRDLLTERECFLELLLEELSMELGPPHSDRE
ncbi:LysR family transcriptional regulator [Roseibium sp. SCP14]|uniref:LysR family transcriptional regulator n=1 Tax=Roseibium sp. SCP14 TaxID=3141375 RepID=UPI00333A141D